MPSSQQSPINLHDPIYAELGDRGLEIHWDGVVPGQVVKDEHGLKVNFAPGCRQYVRLDGKVYHLASFHFHHPSEHWVAGEQYPVELHVVHKNIDDGSLAVVGIFLEVGEPKDDRPELVRQLKTFLGTPFEPDFEGKVDADPMKFLPENPKEYYRYEGSLTTPEFTENVSWAVLRNPFLMEADDLKSLIVEFRKPARFPEPLNRRFILASFRPDHPTSRSRAGAGSEAKGRGLKSRGKRTRGSRAGEQG